MGKLRKKRLQWYGHVTLAKENSLAKIGLNIEIDGRRPKIGRNKGGLVRWMVMESGDCYHIWQMTEQNGNHDEPIPFVNGIKAKEKEFLSFHQQRNNQFPI